jgi:hypothetical protein
MLDLFSFLLGVASVLMIETVVLILATAWMVKELMK